MTRRALENSITSVQWFNSALETLKLCHVQQCDVMYIQYQNYTMSLRRMHMKEYCKECSSSEAAAVTSTAYIPGYTSWTEHAKPSTTVQTNYVHDQYQFSWKHLRNVEKLLTADGKWRKQNTIEILYSINYGKTSSKNAANTIKYCAAQNNLIFAEQRPIIRTKQ